MSLGAVAPAEQKGVEAKVGDCGTRILGVHEGGGLCSGQMGPLKIHVNLEPVSVSLLELIRSY
jgi:hypothetical protein